MKFLYAIVFLFPGCNKSQSPADLSQIRTIVFVNKSENVNHLLLMDLNSSGSGFHVRRLTANTEAENYPSWSPDGKRLAYQRDYYGSAIYIADANGKNQFRLSPTPGFDATPSWSPDGKQIIYTRVLGFMVPGQVPKTEIHIINADGSDDHIILPKSDFSVEPRWSVNNQIVFMSDMNGGQQIFTMNNDGSHIRQLTAEGSNGDPVWSPDGSEISFGSNREGNGKLNIFVMHANGSNIMQLTHFGAPLESGDTNWSADGKKIIFEYDINGHLQSDPNAYAEVWTMNTDGTQQLSTRQSCSSVGCAPRWRPGL
jgi:Tol biopolymer transport system component